MRQENIDSDILYSGTKRIDDSSASLDIIPKEYVRTRTKSHANERENLKSIRVGRVKLSLFEKLLLSICFLSVFVGLFVILQGRIRNSNVSYQIDHVNSQIQMVSQKNQDLNAEVQVLSNSSRLEELARQYGFQLDESRVQNVSK
ncbi:cell division protein FtsL [Xylocopilactobacillus apis]|uniref:Cell division protein FtsL n=1 Tax=Xylocopilactobacillus apis TaxID=2932183 RepID=A0AAU9D1Q3_9LACO|nr:cell division protein FtsL [Xylocopilactobacillus apis]BDR56210.1 hypothetical protein KIMC2_07720 [Xylocopilactobacillus apis]